MNRPGWRVICIFWLLAWLGAAQTQRGVALPPQPNAAAPNGAYYALVIGIDAYPHWPPLQTAASDARSVAEVLRQRYGFQVTLLVDASATRANILNAFGDYRRRLRENDNLLIYYAGHGARDGGKAYWLPVDSDPDSSANWIIADEITKGMQVIPARHILVISDSCYSGGLSRSVTANTAPTDRANYIQTMLNSKSRVLISSGRDEPVADSGSGGHSVFAAALLNGLRSDPEKAFTASNLFSQYVQEAVAGGSKQVPLYQMIQDSGHEFGDFVFLARGGPAAGGTPAPKPPVDRRTAPPSPGGVALSRASTTRLAPDGRTAKAPPLDGKGALPLTSYRVSLLEFRDLPRTLSDAYVADIAKYQINGEQQLWKAVEGALAGSPPPGVQLNPQRPKFVFEWQKEMESDAGFAANALLPVFLRPDPDWSFLKKQKGWDEQYDAYVYVFLFDHEKIQGRQPEFVARDMVPLLKKQLQMAVAKAPSNLYFDVPLHASYDLDKAAIRFQQQNTNQTVDEIELLTPMPNVNFAQGPIDKLPPPADREYRNFIPAAARATANYNASIVMTDVPLARPGVILYGADPQEIWRKGIAGNTFNMRTPPLGAFAFDRELKLKAIPLDPKRAEPLLQALRSLRARIYIGVERMDLMQTAYERQFKPLQGMLFAHVQEIEILGPKDEAIAGIPGASLPTPAAH